MPSPFLTDISKAGDLDDFRDRATRQFALERGARPTSSALHLASDASSHTTGALNNVDGGPR